MCDIFETAGRRPTDQNLGLRGKRLVHTHVGFILTVKCLISVFGVIRCFSDFWRPCISETASRRVKQTKSWASVVIISCI